MVSYAGERVIIFATEENLRRLWFMDGNFAMAPNLFRNGQLYVIMSQANSGVVTPEVFALLQRKTQASYEYLFSTISEHCLRLGFLANPRNIMIEFEYSTMRVIESIFGIGVIVKGCFFIFARALTGSCKNLGL